jgi:hypothetical protein
MGASGIRAIFIATALCVLLVVGPAATAAPVIHSPRGTITPGGTIRIDSGRWYPDTGGCASKVKVTVTDSAGEVWNVGNYNPRFSLFEGHFPYEIYDRSKRVPEGLAPGTARMRARQVWGFKFPVINICIDLFSVSATRTLTIQGALGNAPPVISDLSAGTTRHQRTPQPITWTATEACAMSLTLIQSVGGVEVELGTLVDNHPGVVGANSYGWDSTFRGADLTTGTYRLKSRCVDTDASASAPDFTSFRMGFLQ